MRLRSSSRQAVIRLWNSVILAWDRYIRPRLTRKNLLFLLFPIISLVASIIILSPLLLPQGLPFYGDETYYIPWIPATVVRYNLQIWTSGSGPSTGILSLFQTLILVGLSGILGQEIGVKGYLLLMAWLSAFIPYVATKQLLRHWNLVSDPRRLELAGGVSGLASLLFFSNQATVAASNSYVWNYSLLPILASCLIIFIDTGKIRQLLIFGIASVFASVQPFWPYLVGIVGLTYVIFRLVWRPPIPTTAFTAARTGRIRSALRIIKNSSVGLVVGLSFNAFWIVPIAAGYVSRAGGSTFQVYGAGGAVSLGELGFLSFWSLKDILMMGESAGYFFWNYPQNYTLFSIVIPLVALTSVLVFRKNRSVFFVGAVLIVGALATAGVNEPLGLGYYKLTTVLPYGAAAILRNPTKFVPIVVFAYGLLLGLGVIAVNTLLSSRIFRLRISSRNLVRYSIVLALVFLVLAPITYGALLDLQGYTYPRYSPTEIPPQYGQLNDWLTLQPGDYKVMWIPSGGAYDWKQYAITAFPDGLSSKPTVPFTTIYPNPLGSTNNIGRILSFMGVKYVVFHSDSIDYPNEQILQELLSQQDLTPVESLNGTTAPTDNSLAPLPIGVDIGGPGTSFGDSPFHLSNTSLTRGYENLTMSYTIPQSVGYTGMFQDWFNIGLNGFPAGSADFSNRVFFATVAHQDMISPTNGYASFNVTTPSNYPETSIDLYANYYDSEFRPLTPLYFIDRLTLVPNQLVNRYIIFENKDFAGPVFTQNLDVANNSNVTQFLDNNASIVSPLSANVTGYEDMGAVEFRVTARASSPFLLILTEPYDSLWRAYIGNSEIKPMLIYGLVDGFLVYQTGVVNIRIDYTLQNYLYIGIGLSLASLAASLLAMVLVQRRNRRRIDTRSEIIAWIGIPARPFDPRQASLMKATTGFQ